VCLREPTLLPGPRLAWRIQSLRPLHRLGRLDATAEHPSNRRRLKPGSRIAVLPGRHKLM
jgi:hypothetical protein